VAGSRTPLSNPSVAILAQSKRFPLAWDALKTPLPTWRALLPETRDPRDVRWRGDQGWVVKPALGRVGEGVGIGEAIGAREWTRIQRSAFWWPRHWVAQRRFRTLPVHGAGVPQYPCLGVYTVDTTVAGAYGRLAPRPLIDSRAHDAAVLLADAASAAAVA
jgi:glutathionylspermidine synthase